MRLLYFIVSHSLFIAICAAALCFQTVLLLHVELSVWLYLFVFCATICSYNFYWLLSGWAFSATPLYKYLGAHVSNLVVFFLAAMGVLVSIFFVSAILPAILVAAGLTLLYAVPLLPVKKLQFTRKAGLLKTILLAFTWAFITVLLPYSYAPVHNTQVLLLLFCIRFVFMLLLCIMFDARDTEVDKIKGLQSLTTLVSAQTVRVIILLLFAVYLLLGLIFRYYFNDTPQIIAFLITAVAVAVTYRLSLKKQGYLFYYFIVDGLMLFAAAATFIAAV